MRTVVNSRPASAAARTEAEDADDTDTRGLLHDLGHGLATLSFLTEGLDSDLSLPRETRERLSLVERELSRLRDLIGNARRTEAFRVRCLMEQLVSIANKAATTSVTLRCGDDLVLLADQAAVWRMVSNLVGNAVRAAGPSGRVEVGVTPSPQGEIVIDVADNGPGFGCAPRGSASLGLIVTTRLARRCGARLRIDPRAGGGTRARLIFPAAAGKRATLPAMPVSAESASEGVEHG